MQQNPQERARAEAIHDAQDRARSLAPPSFSDVAFGTVAAYRIAARIHAQRCRAGWRAVGRKIGFTNARLWRRFNVNEPVWGYVYDRSSTHVPARGARFSLTGTVEPRIEPEIILRLASAPRAGDGPAQILDCVEWIAHGFEIVQSHYPDWRFSAADTIADNGLHAHLLIGPRCTPVSLHNDPVDALVNFRLLLHCNGAERAQGHGADVLGSPLLAVAHMLGILADDPHAPALAAGELITTGSLTDALTIAPGETWSTAVEGIDLPGLELTLTP